MNKEEIRKKWKNKEFAEVGKSKVNLKNNEKMTVSATKKVVAPITNNTTQNISSNVLDRANQLLTNTRNVNNLIKMQNPLLNQQTVSQTNNTLKDFSDTQRKFNENDVRNKTNKDKNILSKGKDYVGEIGRSLSFGIIEPFANIGSMAYNLPTKLGNTLGLETVQQQNAKMGKGISPEEFTNTVKEIENIENERISQLGTGLRTASRWSRVIGNMIPSMLMGQGLAVGNTAEAVQRSASAISSFTSALNSGASTYNETLNEEQDNFLKAGLKAGLYGFATKKIEGITGGNIINKFGSLDDIATKGISKVAKNELQKKILSSVYGAFGETAEENLENWTDHLIDYAFGDAKDITAKSLLDEAKQTSIDTTAVNFIMQLLGMGGATYNDVKLYEAEQKIDSSNLLNENQKYAMKEVLQENGNPNVVDYLLDRQLQKTQQNQATTMQNNEILQSNQQVMQQYNKTTQNKMSQEILGNGKYQVKMPNSNYIFTKSGNANVDNLRQDANKYWNNSKDTQKLMTTLEKIMTDKNISIRLDDSITDGQGNVLDGRYENGTITINPNSSKAIEYVATHELTHAIGTKDMLNIVQKYRESNAEFNSKVETLLKNYEMSELTEEALADVSAELFGTQEFISNVQNKNPNLFQKIYNEIKYLWHQLKGYKNESQFIDDLYNKWTKAYNSDKELNQTTKNLNIGLKGFKNAEKNIDRILDKETLEKYRSLQNSVKKAVKMAIQGKSAKEILKATNGKWTKNTVNNQVIFNISDKDIDFQKRLQRNSSYTLGEIIRHDELFFCYPELLNLKVMTKDFKDADSARYYDGKSFSKSKIEIQNRDISNKQKILQDLVHEIQHAVQRIEGTLTAKGYSDKDIKYLNNILEIEAEDQAYRYKNNIENNFTEVSKEKPQHPDMKLKSTLEKIPIEAYNLFIGYKGVVNQNENNKRFLQNDNRVNRSSTSNTTGKDSRRERNRNFYRHTTEEQAKGNYEEKKTTEGLEESSSFSMQNPEWYDYVESKFKTEGTRTNAEQVKAQPKKISEVFPKQEPNKRRIVDEVYVDELNEGKIRKHYKSVFESDQVGDVGKDVAKELLKQDTYVPISNLETITSVNENINRNGIGATYNAFTTKMRSNERITLQDVATGERLIQIYSQQGDYDKVNELIQDVAILGTELGQQVQALSLIKKASPEGQLQYLTKMLERTNIKENTDIKITNEIAEKILSSKNQEELEQNLSEVAVEIADQLPITAKDKIRSWRYLSMLGNPKTHIKNIGANVAMNVTQRTKNIVAGTIEDVVGVFNPEMKRTKTLKPANKEQRIFAEQDAEYMKDLIDAGGKYDVKNVIENSKRQFDNRVLNTIAEFNSELLDKEDKIFLKSAYKMALQNYMSANNLKASNMEGKTLEKARQYASLQAQEATFHEFNAVANTLSQLENKGGIVGGATSAILPFKKTPMNIAKAGIQYSPIGLAKSVTYDISQIIDKTDTYKQQLEDGKITQEQYNSETSKLVNKTIDNMAKGLTGTSIAVLGYTLSKMGVLKAGNDEEDDEFKEKLGEQEYSIKIGDNTYTLDWVSPSAIPLFTGATIYQLATGDEEEQKSVINSTLTAFSKTFEPMTDMSMLQGLTSAITSYEQGSSNMIFDLGASMATSYAGQFVPTALGQVARTVDPYERDTSTTKKGIEGKIDRFARQTINKIPGASQKLPTKKDVWGEEVTRPENIVQRGLENAVLPWTRKKLTEDRTAKELLKVFDETGENVLPGTPSKDLTINKEKYRMTTDEYNQAKQDFGQTSKKLLDDLFKSNTYNTLTSEGKAKAIDDIYAYAKEKLKVDYAEKKNEEIKTSTLYNTVTELQEQKADVSAYFEFKGKIDDLDREKGDEEVKKQEKIEYLQDMKTSSKTKRIIYEDTLGTTDKTYKYLSQLTGNKVEINQYLDYKTTELKADDDPDSNIKGKTVSGSKKKKIVNYLNNSDFSPVERLYIYGTQYSFDSKQKAKFKSYIEKAKQEGKINSEEAKEIYKKLKSIEELEDGK